MKDKHQGFTLLELMMVIAIIGILASIALPSYQSYVYRAKAAEVVTLIDKIHTVMSGLQSEEGAALGSELGVWETPNAQDSDPALQFGRRAGTTFVNPKPVPGLTMSELTQLRRLGISISVSSGVFNTNQSGQYKFAVNVDYSAHTDPHHRLEGKQIALATEHVMKPTTYKTTISRDGRVGLYFQLGGK